MINIFKKHVEYIKDNPEGYWFKAKLYGFGWIPATREGWLVTLGVVIFMTGNAIRVESGGYSESESLVQIGVPNIMAVIVFLAVCLRTGEKLKWNWGLSDKKEEQETEIK